MKTEYHAGNNTSVSLEKILTTLVMWLTNHILGDDMRLNITIANLNNGMDMTSAIENAGEKLAGSKGEIANVMSSMMQVFSASVLELRREITTRKELEEKLKQLALYDDLTGIPNRHLFSELTTTLLKSAERNKTSQAILFIDIDGFKSVNDDLGHFAGDNLLTLIAKRLEDCIRNSDVVARLGGDEFVILLGGNCEKADVTKIASKIVTSISEVFELDEGDVNIGASIGISFYPADADNIDELLKQSDAAMYAAKKAGKNSFTFYDECEKNLADHTVTCHISQRVYYNMQPNN